MAESLARLISLSGPDLFKDYIDTQKVPVSILYPPDVDKPLFGRAAARTLADELTPERIQAIRFDLQRAHNFSDTKSHEVLKFSLCTEGIKPLFPHFIRSAFQKALFLYLDQRDAFWLAEKRWAESRYKFDRRYNDSYSAPVNFDPRGIKLTDQFKDRIRKLLQYRFDGNAACGMEVSVFQSLIPYSKELEAQVQIFWGDDRDGIETYERSDGAGVTYLPQLQTISISLNPIHGTQTICGKHLQRDGRQAIANAVNQEIFGLSEEAELLHRDRYDLHTFLTAGFLRLPARGPILRAGITRIMYDRGPDAHDRTRTIRYGDSLQNTLLRDLGTIDPQDAARWTRRELFGARVLSVDFKIECEANRVFPDGRTIVGTINRNGFSVESKLDVDCYLAKEWFEHLRLRSVHAPLFGAAA